jgi:hypothetical protein
MEWGFRHPPTCRIFVNSDVKEEKEQRRERVALWRTAKREEPSGSFALNDDEASKASNAEQKSASTPFSSMVARRRFVRVRPRPWNFDSEEFPFTLWYLCREWDRTVPICKYPWR